MMRTSAAHRMTLGALGGLALLVVTLALGACGGGAPAWPTAEEAQKALSEAYGYTFDTATTTTGDPQWKTGDEAGSWFLSVAGQPGKPATGLAGSMAGASTDNLTRLIEKLAPSVLDKVKDTLSSSSSSQVTVNHTWEIPGGTVEFTYAPSLGLRSVLVLPAGAASASAEPSSAASQGVVGSVFNGDGYSITIPSDLGLEYSRNAGADLWAAEGMGVQVSVIRNLLGVEQSLEGALGRAKNGLENAGDTVVDAKAVALPAGPAYKVTSSTPGVYMYAFYDQGTAALVMFFKVPSGTEDAIARTFQFR